jgi:hypothetical protein
MIWDIDIHSRHGDSRFVVTVKIHHVKACPV